MTTPEAHRLDAIVRGHVQGVGFRSFVVRAAEDLGLKGWTRNGDDGLTVQVVMEGPRPALEEMARRLRQGPPVARVDRVDADWKEASGEFATVSIRY